MFSLSMPIAVGTSAKTYPFDSSPRDDQRNGLLFNKATLPTSSHTNSDRQQYIALPAVELAYDNHFGGVVVSFLL